MALQPKKSTADCVATTTGELLPRLFTRSRSRHVETRWSFSVTLLQAFARLPVKKHGALCCPDFPLSRLLGTAIERSALQRCQNCSDMQTNEIATLNQILTFHKQTTKNSLQTKFYSYIYTKQISMDIHLKILLSHYCQVNQKVYPLRGNLFVLIYNTESPTENFPRSG